MDRTQSIKDFLCQIPKAELHLHIEGALEPELMFAFSKRNNQKIPYNSVEEVQNAYQFQNLQSFLDLYYAGAKVLKLQQDFYELTWAYLQRAKEHNVRHVEVFFDPQTHTQRGISFETVITGIHNALVDGQKQLNISSKLILCFLRDLSAESAMHTLEQALAFKDWIVGVGLDSTELGNPASKFYDVFSKAKQSGLLATAHAGEEGPPDYIWDVIKLLNVQRVDHGVRCLEDSQLVTYLKEHQIPLTVCPLSNVKLCVFPDIKQHPLQKMLAQGLCVTVNSDDPAYFGGYVLENYIAVHKAFNLNKQNIYQLALNSFNASFITAEEKQKFIAELDHFMKINEHIELVVD